MAFCLSKAFLLMMMMDEVEKDGMFFAILLYLDFQLGNMIFFLTSQKAYRISSLPE